MNKIEWPSNEVKEIRVPIYDSALYLCRTKEVYKQCLEALGYESEKCGDRVAGITMILEDHEEVVGRVYLIGWFDDKHATIVHEIAHVAFFILGAAGVPVDDDGENEAYCYLLDWLYTQTTS